MKKMDMIKIIVGALVGAAATFVGFKLFGDDVFFGIACVCIGPVFGLIIHILGYFLRFKKEEID